MPVIFKNEDRAFSYLYLTVFVINCFFMYLNYFFTLSDLKKEKILILRNTFNQIKYQNFIINYGKIKKYTF